MEPLEVTTFGHVTLDHPAAAAMRRRVNQAPAGHVERLLAESTRDLAIAEASGRWVPGRPDPEVFVPGDIVALRSMSSAFELHMVKMMLDTSLPLPSAQKMWVGQVDLMYQAVPFFLPAATAVAVMSANQPADELLPHLRLPFQQVCVFFDREMPLTDPIEVTDGIEQMWADGGDDVRLDVVQAAKRRGALLSGVVLQAGPDGVGLADEVIWLLAADTSPDAEPPWDLDRQRGLVLGHLPSSLLAPMVTNLAAAVAWADWANPEKIELPSPATREWRNATRKGAFRRREPRGAAAGVHVLDFQPSHQHPPAVASVEPAGTHASPVAHLRSGHPRRVRVGPRDDWRYEVRWIPPTVVNPGHDSGERVVVYRVPSTST